MPLTTDNSSFCPCYQSVNKDYVALGKFYSSVTLKKLETIERKITEAFLIFKLTCNK